MNSAERSLDVLIIVPDDLALRGDSLKLKRQRVGPVSHKAGQQWREPGYNNAVYVWDWCFGLQLRMAIWGSL